MAINLQPLGTFQTGVFDEGAAEISAYDPMSQRLFVVNANAATIDILDLSDPANPKKIGEINAAQFGAGANSVAVQDGLVAIAIEAETVTDPGKVVFFDTDGSFLSEVEVGALPDMLTFTPDGKQVLVANEGEPDGDIDPEGSVSIIDLSRGIEKAKVKTAGFRRFNRKREELIEDGVRIFPDKTVAQDVEPEFISVSPDGKKAFITLQEANAVAVLDLKKQRITEILPLGVKDHSQPGNGLDASDRDDAINIQNWPVFGLYLPDAIATFEANGQTYFITANEGDDRGENERIADLTLDPKAFPNAAELQLDENLGRLDASTIDGDIDGDGDYDQLFTYGSRSFSIFDSKGKLVFDSGDDFERITAELFPNNFNSNNDENNSFDSRSDNKGPEPEGVVVGEVDGRTYAFIGLERIGGVMVYDVTDPDESTFVQYINNRNFEVEAQLADGSTNPLVGDLGPEGLTFIAAEDSPSGVPLLVVTNEVSGSTTIYEVGSLIDEDDIDENNGGANGGNEDDVDEDNGGGSGGDDGGKAIFTLELLHVADQEAGARAVEDAPRLSAVMNALEAQDLGNDGIADNTLRLSSGDAFIPGLFYNASLPVFGSAGIADIQIQNELGFQAIALGNHEFDFGTGVLAGLIDGSAPGTILGDDFAGTAFPYLSTNLDFSTDPNLAPLEVAGGQAPQANTVTSSVVIDVNGENIGVVGATTPTLSIISSPGGVGIAPVDFNATPTPEQLDALAAEIQAEVDALLAADPTLNKVVLLAHMQQISIELALAERLQNVDIIVAGGSNTRLFDDNDRPRAGDSDQGQYPQFVTNAGGTTTAVVNTDGSYKYVGRLVLDFDADGNIIPESYDPNVSGAYATDAQGVADLNAEGLVDPEIQAIVDAIEAQIIATESNVFGIADVFLNGNRSGIDTPDDPDGVRTQETNLGNLTADANLAIAKEFDPTVVVSIKNGGGIRASIGQTIVPPGGTEAVRLPNEGIPGVKPEGGISQNDIATTLAFNNDLTLLTLTKAELVAVLEHGVGAIPEVSGRFPQISGVKFSYDPDLPEGDRILSAGIFDETDTLVAELVRNGEIVGEPTETFRIVTLNFLAGGGDGYPFPTGAEANRVDLTDLNGDGVSDNIFTGDATFAANGSEQDALAEYLFDNFFSMPFDEVDTGRALDERIQNLNFRDDTVLGSLGGGGGTAQSLVINEVLGSTTGTDVEFVELFGEAGTSLAGLSIIVVESDDQASNGAIDFQFDFGADDRIGDNGFFLVGTDSVAATYGVTPNALIQTNSIENSSYTIALVETSSIIGGSVSSSEVVLDALGVTDGGATDSFFFGAPVIGPDGPFLPAGGRRVTDGVDTDTAADWVISDFGLGPANTPTAGTGLGSGNGGGTGGSGDIIPIYDIQGASHVSPFVLADGQTVADFFANLPANTFSITGDTVTTQGVVTAVDSRGFYLQDPTGDGNDATSDAIFVFTSSAPTVVVGQSVQVSGTVSEFFPGDTDTRNLPLTQLTSPTVEVLAESLGTVTATILGGNGRTLPDQNIDDDAFAAYEPASDGIDFFESIESMLVTAQDLVAVSGTNRFGEIFAVVDQGAGATGISDRGTLNISPDDFNPEKIQIDENTGILPGFDLPQVDTGAVLGDVTGVISYDFGNFQIHPTIPFSASDSALTAESTDLNRTPGQLTVASYNVLNLDPNDADGDTDIANGRFEAIAQQIVNNLKAPDVIGLQEIQDNTGSVDDGTVAADETLRLLVEAIAAAGGPKYEFIDNTFISDNQSGGQPGGNIRTAFLYNPDRVGLVEGSVQTIGGQAPGEAFAGARLPLVATFQFNGEAVTLVNNHFSSKGGSAPILGIEQNFADRQEDVTVNGSLDERQAQSEAVQEFVSGLLSNDGNANVVVLGDLNEFEFVSPVTELETDAGLVNLTNTLAENERYTFIFQGNSQSLDHILVSDNLANVAEFDIVLVNSEFAETPERASDHDPLVARLTLTPDNDIDDEANGEGDIESDDLDIGLYDADTDQLIQPLEDGDALLASSLAGRDLAIAAFVSTDSPLFDKVESIFLNLNNGQVTQTENVEPYALFGDRGGDFSGGTLPTGESTLTFELYSKNRLRGDLLQTVELNFSIVDDLA